MSKKKDPISPGYSFILVMISSEGVKKQKCLRHGEARLAAHRHLLKDGSNEASIITIWTPHTIAHDSSGKLAMTLGTSIVKGVASVSREDAETEQRQEIDNAKRDVHVYAYSGSMTMQDDVYNPTPKSKGRAWMKGTSGGYDPWKKSRVYQGLPLSKGSK